MTLRNAYRAVIFDMDGVLVDSEPAFYDAVNDVLAEEGRSIDWERYKRLLGTSVQHTWRELIAMLNMRGDLNDYLRRYDDVLLDCLRRPRPPLPGVVALLDELQQRDVPIAVATSSWMSWYEAVMESCGLGGRFRAVVTADVIERPKPAPDTYLRAAELLDVPASECIAVEDTPPGIAAAKAAGMYAIQSRASSTALPPIAAADLVIDTLEYFPVAMLAIRSQ
jgi:HAD superfamily hydrolase (TIGR01509 family)